MASGNEGITGRIRFGHGRRLGCWFQSAPKHSKEIPPGNSAHWRKNRLRAGKTNGDLPWIVPDAKVPNPGGRMHLRTAGFEFPMTLGGGGPCFDSVDWILKARLDRRH
jgi:hypothetical protein